MNRRGFLQLATAGGLWLILTGHSPYRQWEVYRKIRLMVLANAEEAESVQLGQALAGLLAKHLPESRAMLARARDINDVVRLIATKQLDTALLRQSDAYAAFVGTGQFADNGKVPLRALAQLGSYLFVCREDLPKANAYQIVEAVADNWVAIDASLVNGSRSPRPTESTRIPVHPGALEYYQDHQRASSS